MLLVIGRMNQESELIILRAAGYSDVRLFGVILLPAVMVALLVGWLSLILSPDLAQVLDRQVVEKEKLTAIQWFPAVFSLIVRSVNLCCRYFE